MIIPEQVWLLWNGAWNGLSWCDVWTRRKEKKEKKTQDIPPSCLQWAVMGTGMAGPHKFPRDPFTPNLFCRKGTEPLSRKNLRRTWIWNADQQILTLPKIVYSSDTVIWIKKNKGKNMGFFLTHPLCCRRWKVCWFVVVNPVLAPFAGPMQRGVRSSSVFTFPIRLKVFMLALHYSVTTFSTNFFSLTFHSC